MTVVKPRDWVLGVGFPSTDAEFAYQHDRLEQHDFIRHFEGRARDYSRNFLRAMMPLIEEIRSEGVTVRCGFGLTDVTEVLSQPGCKAFTLFAHWAEGDKSRPPRVDLFDGMTGLDDFVRAVPEDYDGFFDLCVCHPVGLAVKLRNARPKLSSIRFSSDNLSILLWLRLYRALFRLLQEGDFTALEALDAVMTGVFARTKGKI